MKKRLASSVKSFVLTSIALLMNVGCSTPRKEWQTRLNECRAGSELARLNKCIYFGPSSKVGPGSVLRQTDAGYEVLFRLTDAETNQDTVNKILISGVENSCTGTLASEWKFKPELLLNTAVTDLEAGLSVDLSRAQNVSYSISSWRSDLLTLVPYQEAAKNWSPIYQKVLRKDDSILITQAFLLKGFVINYQFSNKDAASLRAKYPIGSEIVMSKSLGGSASVAWTAQSTNTLQLQTKGDFFLFGVPGKIIRDLGMLSDTPWRVNEIPASANARISVNLLK